MYLECPRVSATPSARRRSASQYQVDVDSTTARWSGPSSAKYPATAARVVRRRAVLTGWPAASTVVTVRSRLCRSMPECSITPPGREKASPSLLGNIIALKLTSAPSIAGSRLASSNKGWWYTHGGLERPQLNWGAEESPGTFDAGEGATT